MNGKQMKQGGGGGGELPKTGSFFEEI